MVAHGVQGWPSRSITAACAAKIVLLFSTTVFDSELSTMNWSGVIDQPDSVRLRGPPQPALQQGQDLSSDRCVGKGNREALIR